MNYFLNQARNNQWANRRLLSACAGLTQQEYDAERVSFFPSIHDTLMHIRKRPGILSCVTKPVASYVAATGKFHSLAASVDA